MTQNVKDRVAQAFLDIAQGFETGSFARRPRILLAGLGSEHGEENMISAAAMAASHGIDVTYLGTATHPAVSTLHAENDEHAHNRMIQMLDSGEVDGAVAMHFPFPVGVSTVGRVVTPTRGREMFVATTTGLSCADRVDALVRNAVYGIIVAKTCRVTNPTVGILNVNGARQCEIVLRKLASQGYALNFAESARADGSYIMQGNDVLQGTPDVMVCDSLSGNILVKMLSSYTTGGNFETLGYGYGPGIGEAYRRLVMIVSRASGSPLVAKAIEYGAQLVKNNLFGIADEEFRKVQQAGLVALLEERKSAQKKADAETVAMPLKEVVMSQISGIEIMDLEDGVKKLWEASIYAESGMGCTGPVILVSDANVQMAKTILRDAGFIS